MYITFRGSLCLKFAVVYLLIPFLWLIFNSQCLGGRGRSCFDHLPPSKSRFGHGQWACQEKAWKFQKWAVRDFTYIVNVNTFAYDGVSDCSRYFQVWDEIQLKKWSSITEKIIRIGCRFSQGEWELHWQVCISCLWREIYGLKSANTHECAEMLIFIGEEI